ncbi:hypothetical protein Ferp_0523 [Ferroglobus placidus DSM 10642]|uniref:Uncharacterized protein n=2 Tax=Ferroglobus placidus TaxID=54261 RepID=D3S364_FERPA|nr:hypothetical protein Ferp_0523 [Ferroglobus placidus DSM 10642]
MVVENFEIKNPYASRILDKLPTWIKSAKPKYLVLSGVSPYLDEFRAYLLDQIHSIYGISFDLTSDKIYHKGEEISPELFLYFSEESPKEGLFYLDLLVFRAIALNHFGKIIERHDIDASEDYIASGYKLFPPVSDFLKMLDVSCTDIIDSIDSSSLDNLPAIGTEHESLLSAFGFRGLNIWGTIPIASYKTEKKENLLLVYNTPLHLPVHNTAYLENINPKKKADSYFAERLAPAFDFWIPDKSEVERFALMDIEGYKLTVLRTIVYILGYPTVRVSICDETVEAKIRIGKYGDPVLEIDDVCDHDYKWVIIPTENAREAARVLDEILTYNFGISEIRRTSNPKAVFATYEI